MSLADSDQAAIRAAVGRLRKKVEQLLYHLDSTETAKDSVEALKEAQRTSSQLVTDIGFVIERVQARMDS
jgi:phage shock protein A